VIILIRHGQSTANADRLYVGRRDVALTDQGRAQALALRPTLSDVAEVWSSPLQRARETARLALPDFEPIIREEFIELDHGTFDGVSLEEFPQAEWREFESNYHHRLGGGESLAEVDARVWGALDIELDNPESLLHDPDRHLAIVAHVSPIKSALAWALGVEGMVTWRTYLDNCSQTIIHTRRGRPRLIRFNQIMASAYTQRSPSTQ
jgi:broad specificity phosphatase PhoE